MSRTSLPRPALILAALCLAASPALADAIANCIFPLAPRPDAIAERPVTPEQLAEAFATRARIEFRSEAGDAITVIPEYEVLLRDARRPVVDGEGGAVRVAPGRHTLADVIGPRTVADLRSALSRGTRELENQRATGADWPEWDGSSLRVTAVQVLDHGETLAWPGDGSQLALALDFRDAETREEPTRSHMLVLFALPAVQGHRTAVVPVAAGSHAHGNPGSTGRLPFVVALLGLAVASLPRRVRPG